MRKRMNDGLRHLRREYPTAFLDYDDDIDIQHSMVAFIEAVWGTPKHGFGFVACSRGDGNGWHDFAIDRADAKADLNAFFGRYSRWTYNLYFCPNPFKRPCRKKEFALSTRWAWCDMDASRWRDYKPFPSLCWKTSPGRYQGLWRWDKRQTCHEAEAVSRSMTYRHGGDRNGWSVTKMLRVPGSINHKHEYKQPTVKLVHSDWRRIAERPRPLVNTLGDESGSCKFPPAHHAARAANGRAADDLSVSPLRHKPADVIRRYQRRLKRIIVALIQETTVTSTDRSGRIFQIIASLHEVGASPDEIASVLWVNPYFVSKHGRSLGKLNEEIWRVTEKLEAAR